MHIKLKDLPVYFTVKRFDGIHMIASVNQYSLHIEEFY